MGGGFGGKETQAGHLAVIGRRGREQWPPRQDAAGPRRRLPGHRQAPPLRTTTRGFDGPAASRARLQIRLPTAGFRRPVGPVADRAVFHADNAYHLSDVEISSHRRKTNTRATQPSGVLGRRA